VVATINALDAAVVKAIAEAKGVGLPQELIVAGVRVPINGSLIGKHQAIGTSSPSFLLLASSASRSDVGACM